MAVAAVALACKYGRAPTMFRARRGRSTWSRARRSHSPWTRARHPLRRPPATAAYKFTVTREMTILSCQCDGVGGEPLFVFTARRYLALRRAARRAASRFTAGSIRWMSEMFLQVLLLQDGLGIQGGTAEIGVHHGKSFIPLCLGLRDNERALCIDIFEDQSHNVDLSGQGSREKLDHNLKRFSVPANRVVVLKASSFDVSARQIVDAVGNVQFFSVDGGHWRDIVVNDLGIAGDAVGEKGVIALDDFLHKEWPDVTRAFFDWHRGPGADFAPLAISPNKLYLVRKESFGVYAERLFAIPSLRSQILKYYNFLDQRVPIFVATLPIFPFWP